MTVRFKLTKTNGSKEYIHCLNYKSLPLYRKEISEMNDVLEYTEDEL